MAKHWKFFRDNFPADLRRIKPALEKMAKEKFSGEIEDRLLGNYAVLLATGAMMQQELGLPTWSLQQSEAAVVDALAAHAQMLCASDDLAQFWDLFERMAEREILRAGRDWSLETPTSVTLRRDGKQERFQNSDAGLLLFIRLNPVHGSYMEQFRRLYDREGLTKPTLEHYLKTSPAFLGNVDAWRFGEAVTSGLVFRFAGLGINLKGAQIGHAP